MIGARYFRDAMRGAQIDAGGRALRQEHREDLARRSVAEKLAESFLVIANAMALDQRDEIVLRIAAERRLAEMRIGGKKTLRRSFQIREIAAAAARDENLGARLVVVLEQQHATAATPGRHRAHQAGRSGAHD